MYRYILTQKESDVIRAMASGHDYSLLEVAVKTLLTPSEISIIADGLGRRGITEISGPDSPRIKLTAQGSEIRRHLVEGRLGSTKLSSDVLITDDASAERIEKNLQSGHLDSEIEKYISTLK
jgi:hypothetical protein